MGCKPMADEQDKVVQLLTEYPLYRKMRFTDAAPLNFPEQLHLWCPKCSADRTLDLSDEALIEGYAHNWQVKAVSYTCHTCGTLLRIYVILRDHKDMLLTKIGQCPPWSIEVDEPLVTLFGEDSIYYKQAIVCMSQSYGLGACAYLRRILENRMNDILQRLRTLLETEGADTDTLKRVDDAMSSNRAVDKAQIAADVCPPSLRPGGFNPFSVLHDELSTGVHSLDEEECLEVASKIRAALEYVVKRMEEQQQESGSYITVIKEIQSKRSNRTASPSPE